MRWLAILALGLVGCSAAEEEPCKTHHNGKYYDLSPLKTSRDYEFKTPGGHDFTINVCRRPVKESFGLKDVNDAEVGGFIRLSRGDFVIGKINTTVSIQDSNPQLTLMNGSRCKTKSGEELELRASTVVEFVCDTAVLNTGEPRLVAQLPPGDDENACAFFIQWRTHVACPTSEPGGAWGFFAFFIFTLIGLALLYLVAGTLYNRFVLHLRGTDQIPKFSIESMKYHASEAVDWIRDLTSGGHGRGGGFDRLETGGLNTPFSGSAFPHSAPSTGGINPVSHQTQVSSPPRENSGSGFVRPHPSRTPSSTARRADSINPISHQAQTSAQLSQASPENTIPPTAPPKKERLRPQPFELESTPSERDFMLGDDEDDDVGSATSALVPPRASAEAGATGGTTRPEDPAVLRGRDMGVEGVTRL